MTLPLEDNPRYEAPNCISDNGRHQVKPSVGNRDIICDLEVRWYDIIHLNRLLAFPKLSIVSQGELYTGSSSE